MMREEDKGLDLIRRVSRELSNIRKEQRVIRLWGGVLLGANLVLLGGSLWVLELGIKERVPQEAACNQPVAVVPVGVDDTGHPDEYPSQTDYLSQTDYPSPPVATAVSPEAGHPPATRAVETTVRPARRETAAVVPDGITSREGMTLRSLARLYYGSEVFWVCIYDQNIDILPSDGTLPPGLRLKLPRPADYGIDATDPTSLQRACQLAKSLAKQ